MSFNLGSNQVEELRPYVATPVLDKVYILLLHLVKKGKDINASQILSISTGVMLKLPLMLKRQPSC